MLYTLSDHNATLMGVTDELGRVVAQYGYTPYGDLLAAELFANGSDSLAIESLAAARGNRLGHQGLRTERFDRPWDGPLDIASAVSTGTGATGRYRSVCHNRNRLYDPAEGRFTGVDPNGLGVPVLDGLAFGGMAIGAGDIAPDPMGHYGDGMNAHVAYGGMPRGVRDPSGLLVSPADVAAMAVMGVVRGLRGGLEAIISVYADNLDYDVDWAMDWSLPDAWHSRLDNSWVPDAWAEGVQGGLEAWVEEDVIGGLSPIDPGMFANAGTMARDITPGPSGNWRRIARGINSVGYVAHHVISFYKTTARRMRDIARQYGFTFDLHSVNNMVGLRPAQHSGRHRMEYHNRVFRAIETRLREHVPPVSGEAAKRVFVDELRRIATDISANPARWFAP